MTRYSTGICFVNMLSVKNASHDNAKSKMVLRLLIASHINQPIETHLMQYLNTDGINNHLVYFHNTCHRVINAYYIKKYRSSPYKVMMLLATLLQHVMQS